MTTESPDPGNKNSLFGKLLRVGGTILTLCGLIAAGIKYGGDIAKAVTSYVEVAKIVGVWKPPAPPPDKSSTSDKELTTGSLPPRAAPATPPPLPCVPERDPGDITGTLYHHSDPQAGFAQLYRGRRVCSPGWALSVAGLPKKMDDGTWRVALSSGFGGIWVVLDTRSDISFLRPEQRVRVEGVVLDFWPHRGLKAAGIHVGSGRITKQ